MNGYSAGKSLLHALMELVEGRKKQAQGEDDGHQHIAVAAAQHLADGEIVHIRIGTRDEEGHGVVRDVKRHTGQDASRPPVEPAQHQS